MSADLSKIMVVDDEDDLREIIVAVLVDIGEYEVIECADGFEAIKSVKSFKPDLILMDVMMPVLDGPSAMKKIQEDPETANIPIIFATAKAMGDEVASFLELGAIGVITKPFDPMKLCEEIEAIWNSSITVS